MRPTLDFLSLLSGSIAIHLAKDPKGLAFAVLLGILLAGLCWYLCTVYTHLWNKRFHVTPMHHALCGLASAITLATVVSFSSVAYIHEASLLSIEVWQHGIQRDPAWGEATFGKAFARVKALGVEDFSNVPPPGAPGTRIPTNHDLSRRTAASLYADEACRHFDRVRPFLGKIVWSRPAVPADKVFEDVRVFQLTNPTYPVERAIALAATEIKSGLTPQVPQVRYISRLVIVVLFLMGQAIPAGAIGWAAYRDIHPKV